MKQAILALPALAAFLAATPEARAGDRLEAYYPEGPIIAGENILFAEMHKDRIVRWRDDEAETFYKNSGCGPTAIAAYADGYAVLCHLKDEVHLIAKDGRFKKRLDQDARGRGFHNPNDATASDAGGVYFTASGIFNRAAKAEGALLYLDADGDIYRLADGLHYANGVHLDRARRLLYVTEHLGGRILTYPEISPGRLGRPAVFMRFAPDDLQGRDGYPLTGPDGLETDAAGNLYAAVYGAGVLLVISPDGEVLHRLETPEPLITNVALAPDGEGLIVTGSAFSAAKPFPGAVRRLDNPLRPD